MDSNVNEVCNFSLRHFMLYVVKVFNKHACTIVYSLILLKENLYNEYNANVFKQKIEERTCDARWEKKGMWRENLSWITFPSWITGPVCAVWNRGIMPVGSTSSVYHTTFVSVV